MKRLALVGGLLGLVLAVGCKKDGEGDAAADAAAKPAAEAAADAGPGYTVVWVLKDGGTSPVQAGSAAVAAPVTLRGWFPGLGAKALAAKASLKDGAKLPMEFSAAAADGGAVAQVTITEPGAGGAAEVAWERVSPDGGATLLTTALELEAPKAAAPAPAPAPAKGKPTKADKKKTKGKKKKR